MILDQNAIVFWGKQIKELSNISFNERFWEDWKLRKIENFFRDKVKGTNFAWDGPDCNEFDIDMFLSKRFVRYLESLY